MTKSSLHWVGLLLAFGLVPATAETIEIGGVTRTYQAILPERKPAPLVLVLHGNWQHGADMATRTAWPDMARREGFAIVFPDGLNRAWADLRAKAERVGRTPPSGTDDIAFLSALVETYLTNGVADPKRVYVTGLSNGGAMTMSMACARTDMFAAAASVIINLTDGLAASCRPSRPIPLLLMNGTDDPLVPFNGGKGTSWFGVDGFWSTSRTVQFWRGKNGCDAADGPGTDLADRDPEDGSTVTLVASRCPPGRDVALYRVNGGGHRFPGTKPDARMQAVCQTDRNVDPRSASNLDPSIA